MYDLYLEVLRKFNKKKVQYIVVGVSGINYYAKNARNIMMTSDFDIFVNPEFENVKKAVRILKSLKFDVFVKENKIGRLSEDKIQNIIKNRVTVVGKHYYGHIVELCLAVSGFSFPEMESRAITFRAGRTKIRVGHLSDILKTKKIANRPKDRLFLEKFKEIIKE